MLQCLWTDDCLCDLLWKLARQAAAILPLHNAMLEPVVTDVDDRRCTDSKLFGNAMKAASKFKQVRLLTVAEGQSEMQSHLMPAH